MRNENGDTTTDSTEVKKVVREYFEQWHTNKMDNH